MGTNWHGPAFKSFYRDVLIHCPQCGREWEEDMYVAEGDGLGVTSAFITLVVALHQSTEEGKYCERDPEFVDYRSKERFF